MNQFISITFCILIVAVSRCRAQCRFSKELNQIELDVTEKIRTKISNNDTRVQLEIEYKGTVGNIPQDFKVDGFHIMFQNGFETNNNFTEGCASGYRHIWVNSDNPEDCDHDLTRSKSCSNLGSKECICSVHKCGLVDPLSESSDCFDIGTMLSFRSSFTLPSSERLISFPIEFNQEYRFEIRPYYRESIRESATFVHVQPPVVSCPSQLVKDFYSAEEAEEICCRAGIRTMVADNVTLDNFVIDLETNTINATLKWLPPSSHHVDGFVGYILGLPLWNGNSGANVLEAVQLDLPEQTLVEDCGHAHTSYYSSKVVNMEPGKRYLIGIRNYYHNALDAPQECMMHGCGHEFELSTHDMCGYVCHREANCTKTSKTNITCLCKDGYHGDGYTTVINASASGCTKKEKPVADIIQMSSTSTEPPSPVTARLDQRVETTTSGTMSFEPQFFTITILLTYSMSLFHIYL